MFEAAFWGFISGSAILIGAIFGLFVKIGNKTTALIMAFGAGVLISALSIDLMVEAFEKSHSAVVVGLSFLAGAIVFVGGDYLVDSKGGHWRKHVHGISEQEKKNGMENNSGTAILLGTFLDGIPESFVVGASVAAGGTTGIVFIIAVFLSNLPEGISGTLGMKMAGMPNKKIIALWITTLIITILASVFGYFFLGNAPESFHAAIMAFASGAILAMLCDTMIPEAFRYGGRIIALVTVVGFMTAFFLSKLF
ncbi:MAG: hypothetical protein LBQ60_16400 [Bacteroidales bacterium]|jgi:ZIP family zinc transporter|nr:hypothetical protein [Bacteroidales bacterium]